MQIDRLYYPVKTLGPGQRIGIWTVGCPRRCPGCTSPELLLPNQEKEVPLSKIYKMLRSIPQPVQGVTISGGEPFYQPDELAELVQYIRKNITADILVYTGYTLDELQAANSKAIQAILATIAVLIDGAYQIEKNDNKPLRGSANQRLIFFNNEFRPAYEEIMLGRRQMQNIFFGQSCLSIGIPLKTNTQEEGPP